MLERYNKILIFNNQGIGDLVHMLPLLEQVRLNFPESFVTIILRTNEQKQLLRPGLVNEVILLGELDSRKIKRIRSDKYDLGIMNVITNKIKGYVFLKYFLSCRCVLSEFYYAGKNRRHIWVKKDDSIHRVERNARLAEALCGKFNVICPKFEKVDIDVSEKRKLIGICVGAYETSFDYRFRRYKKSIKQWPLENLLSFLNILVTENYVPVLIGGTKEKSIIDAIDNSLREKCIDLIGKTDMKSTIGWLSKCEAVVGSDTGIIHIASALGIKTIGLYGPTPPNQFRPYGANGYYIESEYKCRYCYGDSKRMYNCKENACMKAISPQVVFGKLEEILVAQ